VVDARVVEQPVERLHGARLRVGRAVHDTREARVKRRAAAHGAWLHGHVERRARQPVVPQLPPRLTQGQNLAVGRGIVEGDRRVVGTSHDGAILHDDGAHRHLAGQEPAPRLLERRAHERLFD